MVTVILEVAVAVRIEILLDIYMKARLTTKLKMPCDGLRQGKSLCMIMPGL